MVVTIYIDQMILKYNDIENLMILTGVFKNDSALLCALYSSSIITTDQLEDYHKIVTDAYEKRSSEIINENK